MVQTLSGIGNSFAALELVEQPGVGPFVADGFRKLNVFQRDQAHARAAGIFAEALGVAGFGLVDDDRMQAHVGLAVTHFGQVEQAVDQTKNSRENCSALGETGIRIQRSEKRWQAAM
jgi:hypothetical protein